MSRNLMLRMMLGLLCLSALPHAAVGAQVTRSMSEAFQVNDSIVVELVGQAIVEKSATLFMRAAREGTQVALQVTLPEGATSHQWQRFLDHLTLSLRGRELLTSDNFQYLINASRLRITRDTMRIGLNVGIRRRCRDFWIEDIITHEVSWTRVNGSDYWSRTETVIPKVPVARC